MPTNHKSRESQFLFIYYIMRTGNLELVETNGKIYEKREIGREPFVIMIMTIVNFVLSCDNACRNVIFYSYNFFLFFQATSPVASLFITMQHNLTINGKYTSHILFQYFIYLRFVLSTLENLTHLLVSE